MIFLTRFLWHISAHHAAINYPLTDYGAFTLNMPTRLYRDSRVSDDEFSLFNFPNANISAVSFLNSIFVLVSLRHRLQTAGYRLLRLRTPECRLLPAACGLRTADCGLRTADCGMRNADCGLRTADCGLRTADCGLRTADCGLRTADCGLRTADCELRITDNCGL